MFADYKNRMVMKRFLYSNYQNVTRRVKYANCCIPPHLLLYVIVTKVHGERLYMLSSVAGTEEKGIVFPRARRDRTRFILQPMNQCPAFGPR